jgi:molybdopterin-guanine dinucleotide biosynthesis protein A
MLTVVIQAGGRSSRMGQDKALMPFLGQPLIARLVTRLASIADELIVSTNRPDDYAFLGLPLVTDKIPDRGALGGLYTALEAASQAQVAVVACDMPFANAGLIRAQSAIMQDESVDVVIPQTDGGYEPLHAVYRRETCLPMVESSIHAGMWKMISWFPLVKVRAIRSNELGQYDPRRLTFFNVNTPEDFREAEALAREFD